MKMFASVKDGRKESVRWKRGWCEAGREEATEYEFTTTGHH